MPPRTILIVGKAAMSHRSSLQRASFASQSTFSPHHPGWDRIGWDGMDYSSEIGYDSWGFNYRGYGKYDMVRD